MANPTMRDLAEQLLAYEAAAGQPLNRNTPPVFRVSEKLRLPLITLAGIAGFRALLTRALALTKPHSSIAATLEVSPDGSLQGLTDFSKNGQGSDAGVEVIAQLLDLLVVFIGDPLVLRLVHDVWPDLPPPPAKLKSDSKGHDT